MRFILRKAIRLLMLPCAISIAATPIVAVDPKQHTPSEAESNVTVDERPTLDMLKVTGLERSRFKDVTDKHEPVTTPFAGVDASHAKAPAFESTIKPMLERNCIDCHGPDTSEGNLRIDTLNPDLVTGADTEWWSEIFAVVTKGEMPPPGESEFNDDDRKQLVDWLSSELQTASVVRRRTSQVSAFRRMTRYEYNHALQDLLGLPFDFAIDLPPEPQSEDGFQNSSDLLHWSVGQFETHHRIARAALRRATVTGEQPTTLYWGIPMRAAAQREWSKQDERINKLNDNPEKPAEEREKLQRSFEVPRGAAYYKDLSAGRTAKAEWDYGGAQFAFAPQEQPVKIPDHYDCVAIVPDGRSPRFIIELGNRLPDEGLMRVTVRASKTNAESEYTPSLQLFFGWQASNEGRALLRVSNEDVPVTADPDQSQLIQWDIPLGEIYPRNSVRKTSPMGALPSPSEYIRLVNASASESEIQIDYVHVAAPVYDQWPPESHRRIFFSDQNTTDQASHARETIARFMTRAWRRPISDDEIEQKLDLFTKMRPQCESFEEAVVEVLATVLSSPQFLFLANSSANIESANVDARQKGISHDGSKRQRLAPHSLASRLSIFLWCSIPDQELIALADAGQLADPVVLATQVQRMLNDPRSERFAEHFVHQWLDLQLLEFHDFKLHVPGFDPLLKEAMLREPVALFGQVLRENASVLDFIHCDYAMLNERLALHYGLSGVHGNHFRRVPLSDSFRRGGLLTQAGVLAMNSDWPDSHPLKRAIWLLESILADPPPPPPPAVPQIDLADPEIAKMTLKERIEDHRNHAACISCHRRIDPWGIAFENYDALGRWRDHIAGNPIDASSELFNQQSIDGMDGLKWFLLHSRQDQFVQATVSKLATFALGRPLSFADRAEIDAITAQVRRDGDGLRTIVEAIIQSDLFQTF